MKLKLLFLLIWLFFVAAWIIGSRYTQMTNPLDADQFHRLKIAGIMGTVGLPLVMWDILKRHKHL